MNPLQTCATCKFWSVSYSDAGNCHRSPPHGTYPTVHKYDWCGEWKEPDVGIFGIAADWLDENGHPEAANHMRTSLLR